MKFKTSSALGGLVLVAALVQACGSSSEKAVPSEPLPPVQASLVDTAQVQRVPSQILSAVAYHQSRFSATASSTEYGSGLNLGPSYGQTAMGLSAETLGVDSNADLPTQIASYGAWVRKNLDAAHIELSTDLNDPDTVYNWVWQIARMHYPDSLAPKNLQIVYARELINLINQGFIWQDPNSPERVELLPRSPKLEVTSFSPPVQANLQLDLSISEIYKADYFQLKYVNDMLGDNRPDHIKVIHCPFSLSTCLAMQLGDKNPVPMQAHYVIPADTSILQRPIKILQHKVPTEALNAQGKEVEVNNALVIMLVGESGRYIQGARTMINPNWYNFAQLKNMGDIVASLCQILPRENPLMAADTCQVVGKGVRFAEAAQQDNFHYGDIPDFDPSIFGAFITNPINPVGGEVTLQLPAGKPLYDAGSNIPLDLHFITGTSKLEIQRLERCGNGKTVWTTLQTLFLRSVSSRQVQLAFYDEGPNRNGQQFVRALAYGADGSFMGWATGDFFINGFDRAGVPGPSGEACL